MGQKLVAVYEGGVVRPVEPLHLGEHQHVTLILLDENDGNKPELRFARPEEV